MAQIELKAPTHQTKPLTVHCEGGLGVSIQYTKHRIINAQALLSMIIESQASEDRQNQLNRVIGRQSTQHNKYKLIIEHFILNKTVRPMLNKQKTDGVAGSWTSAIADDKQWIGVTFTHYMTVAGVTTRGAGDRDEWISTYEMSYRLQYAAFYQFVSDPREGRPLVGWTLSLRPEMVHVM